MMEGWLGRPLAAETAPDAFVLRYLAAFGPATVADVATWSWLTDVRVVMDRLRPEVRIFRDDQGRELFDVPDGLLPDPEIPAPPRFLPEYDNVLLSHKDRTRITERERKVPWPAGDGGRMGTFLVDGFTAGTWRVDRAGGMATLAIAPWAPIDPADRSAVEIEAGGLLDIAAPGDHHDVRWEPAS
jgi:hypothetical protein